MLRDNPITSAGTYLNQYDIQFHRIACDTRGGRSSRRALAAVHAVIYQGTGCAGLSCHTVAVTRDTLDQAMPRLPIPRTLYIREDVSSQGETGWENIPSDREGRCKLSRRQAVIWA
jgi:hypothetical protein